MSALLRRAVSNIRLGFRGHFHTSVAPRPRPRPRPMNDTGLYGFPHLKTPKGFQRFVDDAIERFGENIASDPGHVDVFPASRIPKQLHHLVKPIYRDKFLGASGKTKEKGFQIITDPTTLTSILQYSADAEVRKMAYVCGNSVPHANLGVLDNLIAARHDLAQIIEYDSYAEYALDSSMASSPKVVLSFLLEMSKMARPMADEEFKAISDFKREKCGHEYGDLEPWDEAYFTGLMKSSAFNLDLSVVASYFPLSRCIEGLKLLAQSLFGVTFRSIPLAPGESWHPDVMKFSLYNPDEGKYPGCAHFAIKGGRRISDLEYQLPVVALVCNFRGSHNSRHVKLYHSEVETLFHEFGHALHSLLSRTDYQHFSGTRVLLDFAETPSNLFEHESSGDVIPEELVVSLQRAKKMFVATELQRQILYALVDQTLFGNKLSSPRDTVSVIADLKRQHTSWKHAEGTHWHTRFSHLLNYGAGYYSYLYAKCFAATIWEKTCKEDPLSLATGSALRSKFLQHGGAKDPADLMNDLVGGETVRYRDGGMVPDITSLCNEMELEKQ
ncbi:hypothetical protein RJ639_013939 [Escallonia herrerae]|uniref:Peptidase M3A/M3B catalytic domain-containing protein n=1 Tax=Escallonia herrerae TaxID=1293975 RepID=A0AA88VM00_9ASTE|nr:hypothetical protein RJ639_013939 [Escallonia herrerae]